MNEGVKTKQILATHDRFLCFASEEELHCFTQFSLLVQQLTDQRMPYSDISRAMVVAAARHCFMFAKCCGYTEMGVEFKSEMLGLFAEALDAVENDELKQILPY